MLTVEGLKVGYKTEELRKLVTILAYTLEIGGYTVKTDDTYTDMGANIDHAIQDVRQVIERLSPLFDWDDWDNQEEGIVPF